MIKYITYTILLADRYGLQIIKAEDKWKSKYPNIAKIKIDELEKKLEKLQKGD